MIFAFRGIHAFQVLLAVAALATGLGTVLAAAAFSSTGSWYLLLVAGFLGLIFVWMFSATLRAPTSFTAISETGTRIRFGGFVDTVVSNQNIAGARLRRWPLLGGLGVRTNFRGDVALATAWGECVELVFRTPVRVWLVPRLIPIQAQRLVLSLRNPAKVVERFGAPGDAASPGVPGARKMRRRGPRTR